MSRGLVKTIFLSFFALVLIFLGQGFFVMAQEDCGTLEDCQALLKKYEKEISQYEGNIAMSQAEQKTLNNKIYLLKQEISKLELEIKKSGLIIKDLEFQVEDTKDSILTTSEKIENSKQKLAEILRSIYEEDQSTVLEIFLSGDEISVFFENLVALESLLTKNQDILDDIKELKIDLEGQEFALDQEKTEWEQMKTIQLLQKQKNQATKGEKEWILNQTKGEEAEYQKLLAESKEKTAAIRQRIFNLIGVPDAPTFGEALEIAKYVESLTGARPAFLLAVLTQESNIGQNVGQCYLKNPTTGSGTVAKTGQELDRVMKPGGDVEPFIQICKESGRDPYNTLVSCPMSFGYGGAMGPAQFIPSTWDMYRVRLSSMIGKPADPWNIRDAFLAAGLYLKDAGAGKQTYNAEWRAAMIYFSGGTNSAYSFYGDSVMAITAQYENDIAQLEKYGN